MSSMLALLPFAFTTHAIKDCCPSSILYYMSQRRRWEVGRKTYSCQELCWKDKNDSAALFLLLISSENVWLINNANGVCVSAWWTGQDLVKMSFGSFCCMWQLSAAVDFCICGNERDLARQFVKWQFSWTISPQKTTKRQYAFYAASLA